MVFAWGSSERCSTFIQRPSRDHVAAEGFPRTSRVVFRQVFRESYYGIGICSFGCCFHIEFSA